ncbi:pentapeptide repeat-containing protein [Streptomyces nigrescens]|uniref:pentapeptide repeat-containing protein n=1 Tax=Streptomyces nigrescens TaxID=1920 RepID=UPI00346A1F06
MRRDQVLAYPPNYPHCARDVSPGAGSPFGCRGRTVEPFDACFSHLSDSDRATYLATLGPGSDLDHRGTIISLELFTELITPLIEPGSANPLLGEVKFDFSVLPGDFSVPFARFGGHASFAGCVIEGSVRFYRANFNGGADFSDVTFGGESDFSTASFARDSSFGGAVFNGNANFNSSIFDDIHYGTATFRRNADFEYSTFSGSAWFPGVTFEGNAHFQSSTYSGPASFSGSKFSYDAGFDKASFSSGVDFSFVTLFGGLLLSRVTFEAEKQVGPIVCGGDLDLSHSVFSQPVTIEAAARRVLCVRTRWSATAVLRLRFSQVDLTDAVLEYPLSIAALLAPFTHWDGRRCDEAPLAGDAPTVRILSMQGVDAAHLVLSDIDLSRCHFRGTVHLDQIHLDGQCPLASTPTQIRRRGPLLVRATPRRTLIEEHYWRTSVGKAGWASPPTLTHVHPPAALAPVYRQLRKALEDGKNEPDAADFYYGEMEMRRNDPARPRAERALLILYWAISGYGLRASRAIAWLAIAMTSTVLAMMLWGVAKDDPKPESTGTVTGRHIALTTNTPGPENPDTSLSARLTSKRFEKSLRVVINSVIFRSSGQDLTTAGTYVEMSSRIVEPLFLGLAVLAVRGRVKR